jgi:uncharacterized protein (DUF983 family)
VISFVLLGFLLVDAHIKRYILRWYGSRLVAQHPAWVFLTVTILLAALIGFVLVPLLRCATLPTTYDIFDPPTLCGIGVGTAALVVLSILFFALHHRFADLCPHCGTRVDGDFRLGKACIACGETFHPRLLAEDAD